jgi:hypothetical protein
MDIHARPFDTGKFWGWICTGGRKIYPSAPGGPPTAKEYGGCAKIGDSIGVLFEFKNGMGQLAFLKNNVSIYSFSLTSLFTFRVLWEYATVTYHQVNTTHAPAYTMGRYK